MGCLLSLLGLPLLGRESEPHTPQLFLPMIKLLQHGFEGDGDEKCWWPAFPGTYCSPWLGAWQGREPSPLFLAAPTQNGFSVTLSWEGGEDGTDCGSNATDSRCYWGLVDFLLYVLKTISVEFKWYWFFFFLPVMSVLLGIMSMEILMLPF